MATQIKTRILNKYDLLANYSTFKPLKGEICIAEVSTVQNPTVIAPGFDKDTYDARPIVGIKVGDGTHTFAELPWIQAVAGDVTARMKEFAGEADIDSAIAALEGRKLATVAELNKLSEDLASVQATVNHAEHGNAALKTAINTLSSNTETELAKKVNKSVAENATSDDKLVVKSTVTADINTAKSELNAAIQGVQTNLNNLAGTGNTATVKSNADAIIGINASIGDTEKFTGDDISTAIKALQDSVGNSSDGLGKQVETLKGRVDGHDTAIGTLQTDVGNLQTDVGSLQTAISDTGALGSRVVGLEAATAGYSGSNTIQSAIKGVSDVAAAAHSKAVANEAAIAILNGDKNTSGSVAHTAAAAVAEVVAGADENFDTLKEIADWIKSDTTGAAEMANDIAEMQGLLGVVEGKDLPATVDARIEAAITGANLSQYAKADDLASVSARVKTIEDAPYATTANVATAKSEVIGASTDAKTANTIHGAKAYAADAAATAKTEAISAAATAADAKYELKDVAKGLVDALAGKDNTSTVKGNADAIAGINAAINAMDYADPDATTVGGVVTKVTQDNGKIAVTHKKITMDEFDPNATFIFYCGTASEVI